MSNFSYACGVHPDPRFEESVDALVSLSLSEFLKYVSDFRLDYDLCISWLRHLFIASMQYMGLITLNS